MSVFITGTSGIIGIHLLHKVLHEFPSQRIKALVRNQDSIEYIKKQWPSFFSASDSVILNRCTWIIGDLLDLSVLEQEIEPKSLVFHAAAMVSFNPEDAKKMWRSNVIGTSNIVNICLEKGIKKLCYVSSIAVLDTPNRLITEKDFSEQTSSKNEYAKTKYYAELEVWRGIEEGLPAVIVRPSVIVGPGQWGKSSTQFFTSIGKGLLFYPPGGTGFVDVRDVADIMIKLTLAEEASSQAYIVSAENLSFKDFFSRIACHLEKPKPKIKFSSTWGSALWPLVKLIQWLVPNKHHLSKSDLIRPDTNFSYSAQKVIQALSYTFTPIEKSIERTVQVYKKSYL